MLNFSRLIALLLLAASLSACVTAPQLPLPMSDAAMKSEARVGVVMTALPKAAMSTPGASCLLCLAIATAAHSGLSTHVQSLPLEDLPKLSAGVAQRLAKKGVKAVVIEEPLDLRQLPDASNKGPNVPFKDFSGFQKQYSIDRLIVIEIEQFGIERTYASYFPTSPPRAVLIGMGYMVNLATNQYEWYRPVRIVRDAGALWDEPPKFPGLTNAYYQMLEASKDDFLAAFGE